MTLFRDRFRVESARLPDWDYTAPAWYFVTICTRNGACVLSEIQRGRVRLSTIGRIVAEEWDRTGRLRANVRLDAGVIMPNHVHGIIRIMPGGAGGVDRGEIAGAGHAAMADAAGMAGAGVETPRRGVCTALGAGGVDRGENAGAGHAAIADAAGMARAQSPAARLQPGSLGAIVGQFKAACTRRIRGAGFADFGWHPRFYDRIIRDADALHRVQCYIANNPTRWTRDGRGEPGLFL